MQVGMTPNAGYARVRVETAISNSGFNHSVPVLTQSNWSPLHKEKSPSSSLENSELNNVYTKLSDLVLMSQRTSYDSATSYRVNLNPFFVVSTDQEVDQFNQESHLIDHAISVTGSSSILEEAPLQDRFAGYEEVGDALNLLAGLNDDEEFRVETSVIDTAATVALRLITTSIPAPKLFSHGSKSVVFNWTDKEMNELYLTISETVVSALLSRPNYKKYRIELTSEEFLTSPYSVQRLIYLGQQEPGVFVAKLNANTPEHF